MLLLNLLSSSSSNLQGQRRFYSPTVRPPAAQHAANSLLRTLSSATAADGHGACSRPGISAARRPVRGTAGAPAPTRAGCPHLLEHAHGTRESADEPRDGQRARRRRFGAPPRPPQRAAPPSCRAPWPGSGWGHGVNSTPRRPPPADVVCFLAALVHPPGLLGSLGSDEAARSGAYWYRGRHYVMVQPRSASALSQQQSWDVVPPGSAAPDPAPQSTGLPSTCPTHATSHVQRLLSAASRLF